MIDFQDYVRDAQEKAVANEAKDASDYIYRGLVAAVQVKYNYATKKNFIIRCICILAHLP